MKVLLFFILLLSLPAWTQTTTEIERINFFPKADAFASASYTYRFQHIETPKAAVQTKEVHNYANVFSLSYGHRFSERLYVGVTAFYEQASENAVRYGIPMQKRFSSHGPREPELFLKYRIREQQEKKGLYDIFVAASPGGELREIGKDHNNRINARNILRGEISHGMWEGEWEFKSTLGHVYYGEGEEKNEFFDNSRFTLEAYREFYFNFQAQYALTDWLFANASAGVFYRTTQMIFDHSRERREIQAGSGSLFQAGLKKPISEWTVVQFDYYLQRNEYFVKGVGTNLEGDQSIQDFVLTVKQAF